MTGKELVLRKHELEKKGNMTEEEQKEYNKILKELEKINPEAVVFSPFFMQ